jgi:hypothetical protein
MVMSSRLFPVAALGLVFSPAIAHATWSDNGIAVASATNQQIHPVVVSDGAGGAVIAWQDFRDGNYDIYVQRLNDSGIQQWMPGGLPLCVAPGNQAYPQIVSDGAGGAIVVWFDDRSGLDNDIYARRVNASGAAQWTANGVPICTAVDDQSNPVIASDGLGGAIMAWDDNRNGLDYNTCVQRITGTGAAQYAANGVVVCAAAGNQYVTTIISNNNGAGIVVWYDTRNGFDTDIYAQRINSIGGASWTPDGVALCISTGDQEAAAAVADGSDGAIVTWMDLRGGSTHDVYAQHLISNGSVTWTVDGAPVCEAPGEQMFPAITSDGSSGAIVSWNDTRSGVSDVYAQRLNASGAMQWTATGVQVCTATGAQDHPALVPDGAGGAVVAWNDGRNANPDIYAQRMNGSGVAQWASNGIVIVNAPAQQAFPALTPVAGGGAIFAWQDFRNDIKGDIYASRLQGSGSVPSAVGGLTPPISITLGDNRPNPFSTETTFDLTLEHESSVSVDVFDVAGRRVRSMDLGQMGAGASRLQFDGRDDGSRALPSGVYFLRLRADGETVTRKMVLAR